MDKKDIYIFYDYQDIHSIHTIYHEKYKDAHLQF